MRKFIFLFFISIFLSFFLAPKVSAFGCPGNCQEGESCRQCPEPYINCSDSACTRDCISTCTLGVDDCTNQQQLQSVPPPDGPYTSGAEYCASLGAACPVNCSGTDRCAQQDTDTVTRGQCVSNCVCPTSTPTPTPTPTPAPTISSFNLTCPGPNGTISWTGTPLPNNHSSCPGGFWVDMAENSSFTSNFRNRCVNSYSISASAFGITFQAPTRYYVRVFNGSHSPTVWSEAPSCAGGTCSINTNPNPVTRSSATGPYNNTFILWNTTNMQRSNVWYYIKGTCSVGNCPQNDTDWNWVTGANNDGNSSYQWNPNPVVPGEGGFYRTLAVTDSNDRIKCTRDVEFPLRDLTPCTLSANPSSCTNCSTLNTTLSASVNTSNMPSNSQFKWDLDGNSSFETTTNQIPPNRPATYNQTTTPRFKVVNPTTNQDLSQTCSTTVSIGTTPGDGSICNGEANQICNYNGGLDCPSGSGPGSTQGITSQQHQDCVRRTGSGRAICVYCPPQNPPVSTCVTPSPINRGPQVRLLSNGYSLEVTYTVGGGGGATLPSLSPLAKLLQIFTPKAADANHIPVDFFRSDKQGFIPQGSGQLVGSQFGNHGFYFDTSIQPRNMYYYQVETNNGQTSAYSQSYAVVTQDRPNPKKNRCDDATNVRLTGASQASSSPTSVTFNLQYEATLISSESGFGVRGCDRFKCDPYNPPPYLKLTASSGTFYLPWNTGSITGPQCPGGKVSRGVGEGSCQMSRYSAQYTLALPPGTAASYTIQGYEADRCDNRASIGSANFSGGTTAGSAPAPVAANTLSAATNTDDDRDEWFIKIDWSPTSLGQIAKIYESKAEGTSNNRWSGTDIGTPTIVNEGGSVTYKIIEDLRDVPAGTYYYGATIRNPEWCFETQTAQTTFVWRGYTLPWIQTTGGDVHSNIRISVPEKGP